MLTLHTGHGTRDCAGQSRRDFLRIGGLGLGALTLPQWLALSAADAQGGTGFVRDRSVVLLYLSGGASHIETFNPNMDAPLPYRSMTGATATSVPGLSFGGTFTRLAKQAHRMSIVRSFTHSVGDHDKAHAHVLSGGTDEKGDGKLGQSMGAVYGRLAGTSHPKTGLPSFSLLTHDEVDSQYRRELERLLRGSSPGKLGAALAGFEYQETAAGTGQKKKAAAKRTGSLAEDLQLTLPETRLDDRRALLDSLDRLRRNVDASGQMAAADKFHQQAFDLITGSAAEALDLSREDKSVLAGYDTSKIQIGHKTFRKSTLGRQMLVARRLVEAGCGFITVHSAGWDMHADGNNPGIQKGFAMLGTSLDIAVSAFLEDLAARGLSEKVLLVITGDFGRTPRINKTGGRDHWARLGTLAFAGGGLPGGAVIGAADRQNGEPADSPVTPRAMLGTIFHRLFDVGQLRVARGLPRELVQLVEGAEPIRGLA